MEDSTFTGKVIGAASQGATGAVVAAALSSVTEPVINRVLVKRLSLEAAIAEVDLETITNFFSTALTTNFVKFPFFEITNTVLSKVELPPTIRGLALGAVFTTTTLPITNYRYCRSISKEVDFKSLYKAYLPTVFRDIVYGICRNKISSLILRRYPHLKETALGRFSLMFFTVLASCLISAPGNEARGYYLQDPQKRISFNEFFKPYRFLRSTSISAIIMSTALGIGAVITEPVQQEAQHLNLYINSNPGAKTLIVLFILEQIVASLRHRELLEAIKQHRA